MMQNVGYIALAAETFGSCKPRGLKFIKQIGKKIKEKTDNKNATSHIIQAIFILNSIKIIFWYLY